jgi:tRNA-2-methylthio-N6-dimethylallyladenosine synthase
LMERQRDIQKRRNCRHLGTINEVMVEGRNEPRQQSIGRSTQNKTVNFTVSQTALPTPGSYVSVLITGSFPNSLLGQMVV